MGSSLKAVETLGALRAAGGGLFAHCTAPNAGHGSPLDLDDLIARYGADFVFIGDRRIGKTAVCRRCGHRGATLSVTANTSPAP